MSTYQFDQPLQHVGLGTALDLTNGHRLRGPAVSSVVLAMRTDESLRGVDSGVYSRHVVSIVNRVYTIGINIW